MKDLELKKTLNELKKTERGRAILKLFKWFIFFLILFIFIFISSFITPKNNTNKVPKKETVPQVTNNTLTLDKLKNLEQNLLNSNYKYEFIVTINNNKLVYNGTFNNNINTGYKETNSGIIKYYIDSTGIYHDTMEKKEPLNNLYEGINSNYINLDYIFNTLNKLEFNLNTEYKTNNLVYKFADEQNKYYLFLDNKEVLKSSISEIKIIANNNSYTYNLTFEFLGGNHE